MLDRLLLIAGSFILAAQVLAEDLLDPAVAFRTAARLVKPGLIEVRYDTAPGYYLYRDRLEFRVQPATATLGKPQLPPGKVKQDEFFGRSVIYRNRTVVRIPVGTAPAGEPLTLIADLQGCADIGVCYPPVRRTLPLIGATSAQ
jgi:thiol:disulfide interchange protein DsbD